jgi:hypothetical protein
VGTPNRIDDSIPVTRDADRRLATSTPTVDTELPLGARSNAPDRAIGATGAALLRGTPTEPVDGERLADDGRAF